MSFSCLTRTGDHWIYYFPDRIDAKMDRSISQRILLAAIDVYSMRRGLSHTIHVIEGRSIVQRPAFNGMFGSLMSWIHPRVERGHVWLKAGRRATVTYESRSASY